MFRNAHIYGIDLADTRELVAFDRTEEEIAKHIGADAVIYEKLPDLIAACTKINTRITEFEVGVFNGKYVTPVSPGYFKHLEDVRGENSRKKRPEAAITAVVGGMASEGDVAQVLDNVVAANGDFEKKVQSRMDISIHNFGDYANGSD